MKSFRFSGFDSTVQCCCGVEPHGCSYRAIAGLEITPRLANWRAKLKSVWKWTGSEFYSGCADFTSGGPFLKPVVRTNSFSRAAAASGAFFSPVSTECTAWI